MITNAAAAFFVSTVAVAAFGGYDGGPLGVSDIRARRQQISRVLRAKIKGIKNGDDSFWFGLKRERVKSKITGVLGPGRYG